MVLLWHLGLGDAIVCNGLVRVLARKVGRLILPAKHHNVSSVVSMFSDLPNVMVFPVDGDEQSQLLNDGAVLPIGRWSKSGVRGNLHWDAQFYSDANVPFDCRWSEFYAPEFEQIQPPPKPFAFVHDKPDARIRPKTSLFVYRPALSRSILNHRSALETADEIHCIDSSFLNLAESIRKDGRLFCYPSARKSVIPTLRNKWIMS